MARGPVSPASSLSDSPSCPSRLGPLTRPPSAGAEQDEPTRSYSRRHDLLCRCRARHRRIHPDLAAGRGGGQNRPRWHQICRPRLATA
ncbi:Os02g0749200 [Oryza sativa Japonica Group]|uniref:Os02g0749200 protein n=1 Tax=Oryza sativa subsp. japonica TaxID=39947 RepID=Q0DXK0_ORYSJ|nr:Os02g0749200 [Oryza sativa Japonica Group]|eukprot:NP_001048124.1 Os02g0749200 [Oryza sativa Japonica Group]